MVHEFESKWRLVVQTIHLPRIAHNTRNFPRVVLQSSNLQRNLGVAYYDYNFNYHIFSFVGTGDFSELGNKQETLLRVNCK